MFLYLNDHLVEIFKNICLAKCCYQLASSIYNLTSAIYHLPSAIHYPLSDICYMLSDIWMADISFGMVITQTKVIYFTKENHQVWWSINYEDDILYPAAFQETGQCLGPEGGWEGQGQAASHLSCEVAWLVARLASLVAEVTAGGG